MAAKVELSLSKVILFALFLFTALLGPQAAIAQTATGSITGTVTDPSDLPISDAAIVVRNADTNTQTHYSTNNVGVYVAPYVQPGNYVVTTGKQGFQTVLRLGGGTASEVKRILFRPPPRED